MSISFSGSELINIAINIEKSGIAFYDVMSKSADTPTNRDIFRYLADMERQHVRIFQDMLGEADGTKPASRENAEYKEYIQALVGSAVFTDEMAASEMANRASTDAAALELAIGAEKDSILFYYNMRELMPLKSQPAVSRIINEEKSHLRQLTAVKHKLGESARK